MAGFDSIAAENYRRPLAPLFYASWDPVPRREFIKSVVRLRAGNSADARVEPQLTAEVAAGVDTLRRCS